MLMNNIARIYIDSSRVSNQLYNCPMVNSYSNPAYSVSSSCSFLITLLSMDSNVLGIECVSIIPYYYELCYHCDVFVRCRKVNWSRLPTNVSVCVCVCVCVLMMGYVRKFALEIVKNCTFSCMHPFEIINEDYKYQTDLEKPYKNYL